LTPSGSSLVILITISVFISFFCALGKYALAYLSPAKFEGMLESKRAKQKFTNFWNRNSQVVLSLTIISTLFNIILLCSLILLFSTRDKNIKIEDLSWAIFIGFCIILLICKMIPEILAKLKPETIMLWTWSVSNVLYWISFWIVEPIYRLIRPLEKLFQSTPIVASAEAIEKEILSVVQEGQKEGVLQETETDMITAIIELKASEVQGVMTPRTDMFCIALDTPIEKTIAMAVEEGHSRIPIYKESRDDIVGILYIKDLLQYWDSNKRNELDIQKLIRQPYFVPETKRIGSLLMEFQKQKIHMAVVVDEYGGTAGIVTIEDIIEEIVGEILDEYDIENYTPLRFIQDNVVEIDARLHVDELNETLQIDLPADEGYETVGGFLFSYIGHIPKNNEIFRYKNIEFTVLEVSPRRIDRLKVTKLETPKRVEENS
jgi:CBS domain containing-hemolysin-like protein